MEDKGQLLNKLTDSGAYTVEIIQAYNKAVITSIHGPGSIVCNIDDIEYMGNSLNAVSAYIDNVLIEFFYNGNYLIHLDHDESDKQYLKDEYK